MSPSAPHRLDIAGRPQVALTERSGTRTLFDPDMTITRDTFAS